MECTIGSCTSAAMPLRVMPVAQLAFDIMHAFFGALEAHRPAQFFGFASRESATIIAMRKSCS